MPYRNHLPSEVNYALPRNPTVTGSRLVVTMLIFAASLTALGQPTGKVYRIGYLSGGSPTLNARGVEAFRQGLRDFGWVEGQNIVVEYRFAEGRVERLPELAAELVRSKLDVLVAGPTPPAIAAKNA